MATRHYHIVFNPKSGTALNIGLTGEALLEHFLAAGLTATIDADGEAPLADRIETALSSDADVIVAAGGDGTITALAGALAGTGKTLALLPLGTANLLARDLMVPLDLDQAIAGLAAMEAQMVDVGEVNGRVFLHNVTLGFVTGIARAREQIRGRTDPGAMLGFAGHFFRRLLRARRIAVEFATENGPPRVARIHALVVANNSYDEGLGQIFTRHTLSEGHLSLYILRHLTLGDFFRLSASMLLGRWQEEDAVVIEEVQEVTIRTRKPRIIAMMDGEVETFDIPLRLRIRPRDLSVLAPPPAVADKAPERLPELAVGI